MARRKAVFSLVSTVIFVILLVCASYQSLGSTPDAPQSPPPGFYHVKRSVDGDTFVVDMNGSDETIRFIGIDTPETHKPDTPVQCFGPEASAFTKAQTEGKNVRLQADPTGDNRDRYGRLLRYVYLQDNSLLQTTLIEQGYAFAYLSFPFQKKDDFAAAQQTAQQAKSGLWSACQPTYNSGRWQSSTATP